MSEPQTRSEKQRGRHVLVISGGGAKGAYSFGCLKAFKENGINFDVVAGTSAGALNALLWATDSLEDGERLWRDISYEAIYPVRILDPRRHSRVTIRAVASLFVVLRLIWSSLHALRTPYRPVWILIAWLATWLLIVSALPLDPGFFTFGFTPLTLRLSAGDACRLDLSGLSLI